MSETVAENSVESQQPIPEEGNGSSSSTSIFPCMKNGVVSKSELSKGVKGRVRSFSAVPDDRYEKLLQCLATDSMVMPTDPAYKYLHRLVHMDRLIMEHREDIVFGKSVDRIVDKVTNLIVPRTSEIPQILQYFYDNFQQPGARTLCGYANRHYCGIGKTFADDFIMKQDRAKRGKSAVIFPKPPRLVATKPMQHLEIDVMELCPVIYGAKTFSHVLSVQCLFSRYTFAKPLSQSPLKAIVTKHLMDIFSSFGPPEAYQTYTGNNCVDQCMPEVASDFRIPIHCYGRSGLNPQVCSDHYILKRKLIEKSMETFKDELHWVDVVPSVVMEKNMRPQKCFGFKLSPFEVMFGRQPWSGNRKPPWIENSSFSQVSESGPVGNQSNQTDEISENIGDFEGEEDSTYYQRSQSIIMDSVFQTNSSNQQAIRKKATDMLGVRLEKSIIFKPGDAVYVKNPEYVGSGNRRFLTGKVVSVALSNKEWPYKVRLKDDKALTDDSFREEWFSCSEVIATTKYLELIRKGLESKTPSQCDCSDEECKKVRSKGCVRNRHRECCKRTGQTDCAVHFKIAGESGTRKRRKGRKKPGESLKEEDWKLVSSNLKNVRFRAWKRFSRSDRSKTLDPLKRAPQKAIPKNCSSYSADDRETEKQSLRRSRRKQKSTSKFLDREFTTMNETASFAEIVHDQSKCPRETNNEETEIPVHLTSI